VSTKTRQRVDRLGPGRAGSGRSSRGTAPKIAPEADGVGLEGFGSPRSIAGMSEAESQTPSVQPLNLCRACGEDFGGLTLFDRHRTGKHEYRWGLDRPDGRRCLHPEEMEALGWRKDRFGRWSRPTPAIAHEEARRS
jgi:hypothetical protein